MQPQCFPRGCTRSYLQLTGVAAVDLHQSPQVRNYSCLDHRGHSRGQLSRQPLVRCSAAQRSTVHSAVQSSAAHAMSLGHGRAGQLCWPDWTAPVLPPPFFASSVLWRTKCRSKSRKLCSTRGMLPSERQREAFLGTWRVERLHSQQRLHHYDGVQLDRVVQKAWGQQHGILCLGAPRLLSLVPRCCQLAQHAD